MVYTQIDIFPDLNPNQKLHQFKYSTWKIDNFDGTL